MQWYQDGTPLCSENKGNLTIHQKQSLSNFHCEYEYGQLSLVFHEVQPMDIREKFMCKLRSNQGADQKYSMVELQGQSPHLFLLAVINVQNMKRLFC